MYLFGCTGVLSLHCALQCKCTEVLKTLFLCSYDIYSFSLQDPLKKAQLFKNEGNKFFKAGKFDDAISMYSKAIEACPSTEKSDVFFQNRAAAYEQLVCSN